MAVATEIRNSVKARPLAVTILLSVIGYVFVIGTFAGIFEFYPTLSAEQVRLSAHLIAVINTLALAALLVGVHYVKTGEYRKHRAAMLTAFSLILLFLVVYLTKVGGGFEREIVGAPTGIYEAYLAMLAIHILLSIVSVPVVIYAVVLGLTHSFAELEETRKALVGKIAGGAWILSLALGIITYLLLNHIYGAQPREPRGGLLLLAVGACGLREIRRRVRARWAGLLDS
ncbi:MAG: putative membrane protein [Natronomonas sp.]|jgi:putative membrane protein